MKTILIWIFLYLNSSCVNVLLRKEKDVGGKDNRLYENVEIVKKGQIPNKVPDYVQPVEKSDMKTAILVNEDKHEHAPGLTERPNFLSPVITSFRTSVATPQHLYGNSEGSLTYDLDAIKKKHYFEMMAQSHTPANPNFVLFGGDNQSSLGNNNLPSSITAQNVIHQVKSTQPTKQMANQLPNVNPIPLPQMIPHQTIEQNPNSGIPIPSITQDILNPAITTKNTLLDPNSQKFNMAVSYKGQVVHNSPALPDLSTIEKKLENIDKLSNDDLSQVINQLRNYETHLEKSNDEIYKNVKRYEAQNSVLLESLKDEISDANNKLESMIVEVPMTEREIINKEIEEEFSKSIAGYTINKAKFAHLKNLDPKELFDVSSKIKKELDANDQFYLHGDFNFYN